MNMCTERLMLRVILFCLIALATGDEAECQVPPGYFTDVKKLGPAVNTSSVEGLPDISADGLTLYYASRQPGGFGGLDLYQATRPTRSDPFGNVMNLGANVNRAANEDVPVISNDGLTLYFNSDGPGGFGGRDLYQAMRPTLNDKFANTMNLGPAINTSFNESGGDVSADGLTLYFASRPAGNSDLYMATRKSVTDPFANVTNFGPGVNGPTHESSPRLLANGLILFFSDDWRTPHRPGGQGNADIWVAMRSSTDDPFGNVVNLNDFSMGSAVNGPSHDFFPTLTNDWPASGSQLFFHRFGAGLGGDIWQATWVTEPGDFNGDSFFTATDIDMLSAEIVAGTNNSVFDLTDDGTVDGADLITWRFDAATINGFSDGYFLGDSNLDGSVDAADLNNLALNWRQESALWSHGDFNADGVVNSADLNELALNWRGLLPFAGTVPIKVGSDAYAQTFDEALGTDGEAIGTKLPAGWTVRDNGIASDTTMRSFPVGSTLSGSSGTTASYNAGGENESDRTLAVGVGGSEDDLAVELLAQAVAADAASFQIQFDVEAWDAVDGIRVGNSVIAGPDNPGEAAFKLTVDLDAGDGFMSLVDLGTFTTGPTLEPVFEGIVDGNADANRLAFDSGVVATSIPVGSKLRFRWAPDFDAQTNGWVFGIDNVSLRLFPAGSNIIPASVPEPSGLLLVLLGVILVCRRPRHLTDATVHSHPLLYY